MQSFGVLHQAYKGNTRKIHRLGVDTRCLIVDAIFANSTRRPLHTTITQLNVSISRERDLEFFHRLHRVFMDSLMSTLSISCFGHDCKINPAFTSSVAKKISLRCFSLADSILCALAINSAQDGARCDSWQATISEQASLLCTPTTRAS